MPGYDGTGPRGIGPMTGRGMGYCAVPNPNYYGAVRGSIRFGRSFGSGLGRGRGFGQESVYNPRGLVRPRFIRGMPIGYAENPYQPPTKEHELADLNNYQKEIKAQLKGIEKRIEELSK